MFDNAMRMQELKSQQAYRQLQERQLAQTLAVQMEQHDLEVQRRADMTKALARVAADTSEAIEVPVDGPPTADGMAPGTALIPNPQRMSVPDAYQKHVLPIISQYDKTGAVTGNVLADLARMRQEQFQPGFETVADPRTGREYSSFRSSRNSAQLVHQPEPVEFTDPNTGKPVGAIQQGNTTKFMPQQGAIAKRMGATAANEEAKKAPHLAIQNPNAPEGFLMIDPARRGEFEAQSQLTPADRSDLTQRITKLTDTAQRLNPLIENADKIFGPKALAGTVVVDRVLANFNPKLAVGQRIQGREAARFAIEGLIRSMNEGQGAPSDQDRKRIEALFPELGNVEELLDNPTRASEIFRGLQKELARDAVVNAHMMGQKPPREAWQHASPAFLLEQLKSKRIDRETFIDVIDNNVHKSEVQAVLNSLN
jgi:hypothetical protein